MEKDLIGILLSGSETAKHLLSKLKADDFADTRSRIIFQLLNEVHKKHGRILTKASLEMMLKQLELNEIVTKTLMFLESVEPKDIPIEDLQIIMVPIIKKRIKEIVNTEEDIDKIRTKIDAAIDGFGSAISVFRINEVQDEKKFRIPTAWDTLNKSLPYSFNRGDLCLVLAGVNAGKTMFLCNLLKSPFLAGLKVKYVSCEDGAVRIKDRLVKILRDPEKFFSSLKIDFSIIEAFSPNISVIAQVAKNCDMLIIDYLDRIDVQLSEYRFMLRHVAESLKKIAEETKCLIWTAKQIRREGLKKQLISMIDVGESFAVCESPDLILGVAVEENKCYVNIAKSRDMRLANFVLLNCDVAQQEITDD